MGKTEKHYLITTINNLDIILNLKIDNEDLKAELDNEANNISNNLIQILNTKPNFEQHLKEQVDLIYQSQKFLKSVDNENYFLIKELFLNSYEALEKKLELKYKKNYEKSFKSGLGFGYPLSFITPSEDAFNFKIAWMDPDNQTTEAYFKKRKLSIIFVDFTAYKFFLELKKLLCDKAETPLVEYSFIFRMMHSDKLIIQNVSESAFRNDFLDIYFDIQFTKLKTLLKSESPHRKIIYKLVRDKIVSKWYNTKS